MSNDSIAFGRDYFAKAFEPESIRRMALKSLKGIEFDTIIGSGHSGVLPLGVIARSLKVNMCIVRKQTDKENSHARGLVEGFVGKRWIFVDDFISTGATFVRVSRAVNNAIQVRESSTWVTKGFKTECVGAFLYEREDVIYWPVQQMINGYGQIADYYDNGRTRK